MMGSAASKRCSTTLAAGTRARSGAGPGRCACLRKRGPDHQGRSVAATASAATAAGSYGGSTMAKLVVAGSASGRAIAPSSLSLTTRAIGHERRIEPAGPRGDDDIAALERVAADLERTDVDRAVAASLRNDRDSASKQSRRNDVRPVGYEKHSRSECADVDDPADEAVGRAHRHAHRGCRPCARRQDGEAAGAVERGADDPPDGDRVPLVLAQLKRRFELAILLEDCLRFDHPLEHRLRSRFSSPFWRAASQ